MKTIIFFDLDNTLHNKPKGFIPDQTIRLIRELSKKPNVSLGLATGRGPYKVGLIDDIIDLFEYKIFINGALAYKKSKLIYNNPINKSIVKSLEDKSKKYNVDYGFVYEKFESRNESSNKFEDDIYQVYLFTKDDDKIKKINVFDSLDCHPWHNDGADLVDNKTNKAIAIKELLKNETNYKLVTVGDGHNDIKMIELADVGIAMGNSGFDELKEKAHFIAPHIDENKLYDFFLKHDFFV